MENEETDPLLEHEEKDDDDDEETTNPFQPGGSSTPGEEIPLNTMNREKREARESLKHLSLREVLFHVY